MQPKLARLGAGQAGLPLPTLAAAAKARPSSYTSVLGTGEQLSGVVKSWNGSKGFGFITSDQVAGDVFFSRNELPPEAREVRGTFLEGRSVTFEAHEGNDGRAKATTVHIIATDGQPLAGIIKSYSEQNRYGFVTSTSLSDDVRFQSTDLPPMTAGANLKGKLVTFEMQQLADGKLRVTKMQFQTSKIAATVNAFGVRYGGLAALPATPMSSPQLTNGATMTGTVKSFSERHGYGFINTPGLAIDIKFGKADLLVDTVASGALVSFVALVAPDGRVQARQVQLSSAKRVAAPVHALGTCGFASRPAKQQRTLVLSSSAPGGVPTGQILNGTVKSYIPNRGFGFITCSDVAGDVYFMRQHLPAEQQMLELKGQTVSFELAYAPDGKLRAQSVSVL